MTIRRLAAALLVALTACNRASQTGVPRQAPAGPQTRAVIVTISTVLQPEPRTLTHTLVIAGNLARSGDELDRWRLFDLAKKEVTFVDDIAATYRTVPLSRLMTERQAAEAQPLPDGIPRAQFAVTAATKPLQGISTRESVIRMGSYQRHLWIGSHPLIPPGLFAMMEASRPLTTPLEGVMRGVDTALLEVKGFPFAEHAELPYGKDKLVLDRSVVTVEQRDVPVSRLRVPPGYHLLPEPTPATPARR